MKTKKRVEEKEEKEEKEYFAIRETPSCQHSGKYYQLESKLPFSNLVIKKRSR